MAVSIPLLEHADATSNAELILFKALSEQLNDEFLILHSVAWISKPQGSTPKDGETDFLVVHPKLGMLVIEVKGGRIRIDHNKKWFSIDRKNNQHSIKDPFNQAKSAKYSILEKLKESLAWERLGIGRFNLGHAAFFPNIGDGDKLSRPDSPREIIGDHRDLQSISQWVERALNFWRRGELSNFDEIGVGGVEVVRSIFARVVSTKPLLSMRIEREEKERLRLTKKQIEVLDLLQRQRRVLIAGGAGTGKTIIAREKAMRLSNEGLRTLLVCYNRPLADHVREQCDGILNLDVATFHQVCDKWNRRALKEVGRNFLSEAVRAHPNADKYNELMPHALSNAVDELGPKYDAIIVDEAQDFGDEYWMPIEMLLNSFDHGLLYIFLDENQDIYKRSGNIPINTEPMILDRNCRNTGAIHNAAYEHYRGIEVLPSDIAGVDVEVVQSNTTEKQAREIGRLITKLIASEGILPHNVAILICNGADKSSYESLLASIPIPNSAKYGRLENYSEGVVVVDTVARFKGLERDIIILWEGDHPIDRKTRYVGMSRAKSVLYVVRSNGH